MLYQYEVKTPDCPITYLYPDKKPVIFENTAESVEKLWSNSKVIDIDSYKEKMDGILHHSKNIIQE